MTVADLLRKWNNSHIRGLSLQQPHASLVALGERHVETRSWSIKTLGPIAIASSARWKPGAKRRAMEDPVFAPAWHRHPDVVEDMDDLPLGTIVAVAHVLACVPTEFIVALDERRKRRSRLVIESVTCGASERFFGDYGRNRVGWVLADVHRLLTPLPCKGALSIWKVAPATRARLNLAKVEPVE